MIKSIQNRRHFLATSSVLPLSFVARKVYSQSTGSSIKSTSLNQRAKIKLSLNAWSYKDPLFQHIKDKNKGMSLFDLLEECARLDFDAIDPTGYFFPGYPNVPEKTILNEFKRRAFQLGLDISGTGIRNDFASATKSIRDEGVELAKRWIEVAADIGAPVLRVFAGPQPEGHTWKEATKWMAEALYQCAEHGAKHGVLIGVQNHGGMLKSADEVLTILNMVDSDWLGAIIDTGFFLTSDPYKDIKRVIPFAVNWQVKERTLARQGEKTDMNKLVKIIRASNYRGYLPIEAQPPLDKNKEYDPYKKVPELLAELRKAL